ncbi:ketopantoate reductase family protein [uncultured Ruthenibacterium sp.]|uniref:ketopantoate reductase family protein n=1 Tax=uncultured Ruthenibacterium sp. TaxID=1905347 RepID=UPI00349F04FD
MQDLKIAVLGIGGVGGYLAGMLAHTYSNVSFVARGSRKAALEEKGLILHSECNGEIVAHPARVVETADQLEALDYLFICVKNYSLEQACQTLGASVDDHTVIIPVMNGVDPAERTRGYVKHGIVLESLIYTVAFSNPDFSVTQQGNFTTVKLGISGATPAQQAIVERTRDMMVHAGIDAQACADIQAEIWRKYMLNCAYNVLTAAYNRTIGELRDDPVTRQEYYDLLMETCHVAQAMGVNLPEEVAQEEFDRFLHKLKSDATSSLQRDLHPMDGKPRKENELDTFSGYLVRQAHRLGIPVPLSERYDKMLRLM